ncbi:hypothetical protein A9G17_01920 [Gilliamella sp. wkB7]|uniref:alpha/beta hydrolase n=1 Tax=Gilliamella sp. wkB7 TaxID=3120264 RepID=UPI0008109094|nr:alpha/beta hydrolase-fold protein [Gilliamella apicola]OCF91957.1 hypothetical protein A9G17_01920 [Gilliamella apicola]
MPRFILLYIIMLLVITGCQSKSISTNNVVIPNAQTEIFHSTASGDYKVSIYTPNKPTPKGGWSIIYLLDGDNYFLTANDIIKSQACERCILQEGIIVAIDYLNQTRRDFDFLPKPDHFVFETLPNNQINLSGKYGGADAFYDFLTKELKPEMEKRYKINLKQQAIFGHSYGGLFNLYIFLTKPVIFNTYVVSSPSMWFSDGYMFKVLSKYLLDNQPPLINPVNLLISVGGAEQSLLPFDSKLPKEKQNLLLKHRQNRKMVDNSKHLFDQLKQAKIHNLNLSYKVYPQQSHKTAAIIALQDSIQINFNVH